MEKGNKMQTYVRGSFCVLLGEGGGSASDVSAAPFL